MRFSTKSTVFILFTFASFLNETTLQTAQGQELITPDSEYVKRMVRPAVKYLEEHYNKKYDYGHSSLVGLAIFNAGLRLGKSKRELTSNPVLVEILDRVSKEVMETTAEGEKTMYESCVTGLLLAEVDENKYKQEIEHILNMVYARQMPHGGWGYRKETSGDTSQTQYCALFLWLAKEKKFKVRASVVENAIKFLIATQHPDGGFVYKASPGAIYGARTHSLTAAGLGSVYLLGDAYGLHGGEDVGKKRKPGLELLPPSVTMVVEEDEKQQNIKKGPVRQIGGFGAAKVKGDAWFKQRFVVDPNLWTYYYLYGFERYSSFKERAEKVNPESPAWYVGGAKFLNSTQNGDGSWYSMSGVHQTKDTSTSFAILFLVRSTKLIIPSYMDIIEGGGQGLPKDGTLTLRGGRLVNQTYRQDFDKVLALIETGKDTDWAAFESQFDSLVLSSKKGSRAQQLAKLRNLVTHENYAARKVAVKSIGKFRDFDNIPFLIFALTDPHPEVAKMANDGLRFVSRKFNAPKLNIKGSKPNKQEVDALVKYWSKWYLEVVPEGRLLELE